MLARLAFSACIAATLLSGCQGAGDPGVCGMNVGWNAEESCGPPPTSSTSGAVRCEGATYRCRATAVSGCDCEDVHCPESVERGARCDTALEGAACGGGFESAALTCRVVGDAHEWRYHQQDVPGCDEIWFTRSAGPGMVPWLCPSPDVIDDAGACCYLPSRYATVPDPSCPGSDGRSYQCGLDGTWHNAR
jgi:hypothetical protein